MRKEFENNNYLEKEVVLNIRVPQNFDEKMELRMDELFADVLFDIGCELVDSTEYRDVSIPDIEDIDFSMLYFRDYDDTGEPLQFFFGYNVPPAQLQKTVTLWGYKGDLCCDIALCLDLYSPDVCPLEAILTFNDDDQRWLDLRSHRNYLEQLRPIIEHAGNKRSREALQLFQEIAPLQEPSHAKDSLTSQIESAAAHADKNGNTSEKDVNTRPPIR